jgi:hypothetical protein
MSRKSATKAVLAVVAVGVVVAAAFLVGYNVLRSDDAAASGPYAEFTRGELARLTAPGSTRNPVLLPSDLPTGADLDEESGFYLLNKPITDDGRRHAGEVWLSVYSVAALPPKAGDVSGYSVYQEWMKTPERHRPRCSSKHSPNESVVRQMGDDKMTICLGPHPTEASRDYWETVAFTSDLTAIAWLEDGNR